MDPFLRKCLSGNKGEILPALLSRANHPNNNNKNVSRCFYLIFLLNRTHASLPESIVQQGNHECAKRPHTRGDSLFNKTKRDFLQILKEISFFLRNHKICSFSFAREEENISPFKYTWLPL